MRAPLSYIKTSTDLLLSDRDHELVAETPGIIATIGRQVWHLLDLLDKLLDFSIIEAGQMTITPLRVEVAIWLSEVIARQEPEAQAKNILIETCPVPSGWIEIDPLRLEQALTNLISNALKYSPRDSQVQIEVLRAEDHWYFAISDQGSGVRPDDAHRLFKPFQRGPSQPTGGEKSTGLGLSIARSIVSAHGGEIGVTGNSDGGATFWFTIPA